MCSFRDVDGREVPAMTSLRLGINGARSEQVTPDRLTSCTKHPAAETDFVIMRRAAGGADLRSDTDPSGIETANAVAQTDVAGKLVVRPVVKFPVRSVTKLDRQSVVA